MSNEWLHIFIQTKKEKIFNNIYFYSYITYYFFIIISNVYISCSDRPKSLINTYIENDINKYGCQIKFPVYCS